MADVTVSVGAPSQVSVTVAGSSGGSALVTNGSVATVTVTQAGDRGPKGDPGTVNLSDATPSALGTAAAGTSSLASRADHTHPTLTVFPYASLSGVPSTFAPSTHTHTASQVTDFATQAAKYGPVTSVNGQTGAVTVTTSSAYTLPTATDTVLGGVKVGTGLSITSGVLSATGGGGASLSNAAPSALGTASAGTASTASRSDHVHTLPSLSTLGAAAANHNHPYVTGLNNLTGELTLAAGSNVTLTASGSTITIAATGSGSANDTVDGGDYVGVVASILIAQHPSDVSISINQGATGSASFTVAASASTGSPVGFQWERNQGSAWTAIDAATSATLSLTGLAGVDDGTLYRCVVTAFGLPAVTSDAASLSVAVIVPAAPVITIATQPQPATIASTASTASFSITASVNSGTLVYQWQRRGRGATTFVDVSGATGSTLSLSGLNYDIDRETYYRCRLTATGAAAVTSSPAQLAITWANAPQINIINGPSEVRWPSSSNFFTVTYGEQIFGGVTTTRQWQARRQYSTGEWGSVQSLVGNNGVSGSTTGGSLTLTSLPGTAGEFRCVITSTNSYGTTTATTGTITIIRPTA
jgi:hypothetical protein